MSSSARSTTTPTSPLRPSLGMYRPVPRGDVGSAPGMCSSKDPATDTTTWKQILHLLDRGFNEKLISYMICAAQAADFADRGGVRSRPGISLSKGGLQPAALTVAACRVAVETGQVHDHELKLSRMARMLVLSPHDQPSRDQAKAT